MYSVHTLAHRLHRLFAACVFAVETRLQWRWLTLPSLQQRSGLVFASSGSEDASLGTFWSQRMFPEHSYCALFFFCSFVSSFLTSFFFLCSFFLLFKNSLQSKKNTKIPARFPWYIICLHDILFFSYFQQKSTLFCWIGVKNDKMAKEDYFYLITVLLL